VVSDARSSAAHSSSRQTLPAVIKRQGLPHGRRDANTCGDAEPAFGTDWAAAGDSGAGGAITTPWTWLPSPPGRTKASAAGRLLPDTTPKP